jgi:hypothetical protein
MMEGEAVAARVFDAEEGVAATTIWNAILKALTLRL